MQMLKQWEMHKSKQNSKQNEYKYTQNQKQTHCKCVNGYIGQNCQIKPQKIDKNTKILTQLINKQPKYYYYQPEHENIYEFNIQICMINNILQTQYDQKLQNDKKQKIKNMLGLFFMKENQNGELQKINKQNIVISQKIIKNDQNNLQCTKINIELVKIQKIKQTNYMERLFIIMQIDYQQKTSNNNKYNQNNNLKNYYYSNFKQNNGNQISRYHSRNRANYNKNFKLKQYNSNNNNNNFKQQQQQILQQIIYKQKISISIISNTYFLQYLVTNILFQLIILLFLLIIGGCLLILRRRIIDILDSTNFTIKNDIKHFQTLIPEIKYSKEKSTEVSQSVLIDQQQIKQQKQKQKQGQQCVICLNIFVVNQKIRKIPKCQHTFHKYCIDKWCEIKLTCPTCRKSLTKKSLLESSK